ncbi:MAG TPA: zf-HC2 domain-containing protein [Candidatus Limnocylindrales bacterium]|nr:zf-HC2 domain-containing protein [Candidatus Limnocylindrales bacterium]
MSAPDGAGHDALRDLLARSIDEELRAVERDRLAAHLRECEACRRDEAALRRDNAWLAGTMPVAVDPVVRSAVLGAARARPSHARDGGWYPISVVAAGVAAIVLVTGIALRSSDPGSGVGSTGGSASIAPASPSPPSGTATGRLYDFDRATVVGRIDGAVHGLRSQGSGTVTFRFDDGTSWSASLTYADYWHDPEGPWDVAFGEGCRPPAPGQLRCVPFVIQFVDGRQRADGQDEISLADGTRDTYNHVWTTWYRVDAGSVVVRLAP